MSQNMLGSHVSFNVTDKRRVLSQENADSDSHMVGSTIFTANGAGTTTTLVGANAAPGTDDTNTVRRNEKFRLFDSTDTLKEETVFTIDNITVGASTTVTFSPAAASATASGDYAARVTLDDFMDEESIDRRLAALDATSYTAARLRTMTQNDKIYALRLLTNADSF